MALVVTWPRAGGHYEAIHIGSNSSSPVCALHSLLAADITGKWAGDMVLGPMGKTIPFVLDLKLDGSALSGAFCFRDCAQNKQPLLDAKIQGDIISFGVMTDTADVPRIDFRGAVTGDTLTFILSGSPDQCGGNKCEVGTGSAARAK